MIEEANPPFEMRKVVVSPMHQNEPEGQIATQPSNLPLVPVEQERAMVKRNETAIVAAAPKRTENERTLTLVTEPQVVHISTIG